MSVSLMSTVIMRTKRKQAGILELNSKAGKKINDISGKKNLQQQRFIVTVDWKRVMVYRVIMSPVVPDQRILKASET